MLPHRKLLTAILFVSVFAAGCVNYANRERSNLPLLHDKLTKQFGGQIDVHFALGVNAGTVYVTFINSALNNATERAREQRAEEAAQIVKAHFTQPNSFAGIAVIFIRQTTSFGVFHRNQTVASYPFNEDAKRLSPEHAGPLPDKKITAGYSGTTGTTDVSVVETFQLDGQPGGYGLTVLPHIQLQGDARRRKAPAPAEVSFLFASYSRKPKYRKPVPITFMADGTPVMEGTATFTGNDAQYCSVKVSYSGFRKVITAKEVSIKLGAREYPLTPEQLELLLKMDAYVLQ